MQKIIIKRVFSRGRANDLIRMGNKLLRIEEDLIKNGEVIYLFERTDKLLKDIKILANKHKV